MRQPKSELANSITYHPSDRAKILRATSPAEQSEVLTALSPYVQQQLLQSLSVEEIVQIVDYLDLQTAQVVLRRITDVRRRHKIINQLKRDVKEKVEYFLRFHPKATLSLIHFNYVLLARTDTIADAGDAIDLHYQETGKFPEVLIHEAGVLVGEVALSTLVRERNTLKLEHFVTDVTTVEYKALVPEIITTLSASKRKKVVVLDADGSVLGIIYADDAIELFGKLPVESLYSFTGVDGSELPFDSIYKKFSSRYKWLILNLATAFLAGSVILAYQDTISALTILAVYIPIVAGMGGNAASQTFAVMLRGITMGTISLKTGLPAIMREVAAASINGAVIGVIVGLVSLMWNGDPMLGLVVALSMIGVHLVAGLFGSVTPLLLKTLGRDPASTSMIFITTATDVFGFLILLSLGAWLLV